MKMSDIRFAWCYNETQVLKKKKSNIKSAFSNCFLAVFVLSIFVSVLPETVVFVNEGHPMKFWETRKISPLCR